MNTAVTTTERQPRSVLIDMASRYGMEPAAFEATVRATCMRPDKNGRIPNREEFAAFLLVAKEYRLNPLTKEIYAYPAKGGGIVPIVSLDGWANLINSHPAMDGMQFTVHTDTSGMLTACTCRIFRKDRKHPIEITEYLSECIRDTEPWKMRHRMLRHKALIQCARYAFGFSGIYDEDEGAKIAEAPAAIASRPQPPMPPTQVETVDHETGEIIDDVVDDLPPQFDDEVETLGDYFSKLEDTMAACSNAEEIMDVWNDFDPLVKFEGDEDNQALANMIKRRHVQRVAQK